MVTLRDLHEQLQNKKDPITSSNVRIFEAAQGDDEIEAKVLQSEETTSAITTIKARIISHLSPTAEAMTTSQATSPPPTTEHHAYHAWKTTTPFPSSHNQPVQVISNDVKIM